MRRSDQGVVLAAVTAVNATNSNSSSTAALATCVSYHLTEFAVDSGSSTSPLSFQPAISSSNGDTLTAHDIFAALKVTEHNATTTASVWLSDCLQYYMIISSSMHAD
jgi:hypothetical protein